MTKPDFDGPVAQYFAINLRKAREELGMSQAELAERVKDRGHSCTQATIWKLEQGHREPKISEAVAIGQALGVWHWTELTSRPEGFNLGFTIDGWRKRVFELAEQLRATATAQIDALMNLAGAVRQAQELSEGEWAERRSGGWLELTPEATVLQAVLAARVAYYAKDDERSNRMDEEDRMKAQIMHALETCGIPLVIEPDGFRIIRAKSTSEDGTDQA